MAKARVVKDMEVPAGRRYLYRELTINVGKGWMISKLWGTHGPLLDVMCDAKGRLILKIRKPKEVPARVRFAAVP